MDLTVTIVLSASFGAAIGVVLGKLIDAFLLSKINDNIEKNRWRRQEKLKAFSQLAEELLSLGFKSEHPDNKWKMQSLAARTILLLDNRDTILKINQFIEKLSEISTNQICDRTQMHSENLNSTQHYAEVAFGVNDLEAKSLEIVELLNKELKS